MHGGIKQEADAPSSALTDNMSSASGAGQAGFVDPVDSIDSLLDLSEYDNAAAQYNSPELSPMAASKNAFVRTTAVSTPASMLSATQPMTAPSHQYDQYKQQTGFVPGALANTFAVTQNNLNSTGGTSSSNGINNNGSSSSSVQMTPAFNQFDMGLFNMSNADDMFDFNTAPNDNSVSPSDIDLEFESPPAEPGFYFPDQMSTSATPATLSAGLVPSQELQGLTSPGAVSQGSVGRLWPGAHQQAALAKAQAQQRQQQQIIQQQQQQQQRHSVAAQNQVKQQQQQVQQQQQQQQQRQQQQQQSQPQRPKSVQPSDPIIEQKISQLLSNMRAKSASVPGSANGSMSGMSRSRKDEDDMDEDERLLASEEGKKLSSKERRQLRNKVSARAFRSRRKEYISQLESEIATKVSENGDLRAQNRALMDENKRLSDLTRMLLGSPSFSDFLDRLSNNPAMAPQTQAQQQQQQQQSTTPAHVEQRQQERAAPKDVNPYAAQQQIGMAMIPEQNVDFTMLQMEAEPGFVFQPQVYAVLETPDVAVPAFDASLLSGKSSNFVGSCSYDEEEKIDMPVIEHPVTEKTEEVCCETTAAAVGAADQEFENDPAFALYHDGPSSSTVTASAPADTKADAATGSRPMEINTEAMLDVDVDIFGGIETEKMLARYELVDASEEALREFEESIALARIERMADNMQAMIARLDSLSGDP